MNTTTIILTIVVPLLLSGFANFFAHKPWILYMPLLGLLIGLGYAGHFLIQSYAYPSKELDKQPLASLETPTSTLMKKDERPNQSITTTNQTGHNVMIGGDLNLTPKPRQMSDNQKAAIRAAFEAAPAGMKVRISSSTDEECASFATQWLKYIESLSPKFHVWQAWEQILGGRPRPKGISLRAFTENGTKVANLLTKEFVDRGEPKPESFNMPPKKDEDLAISIGSQ